MDTIQEINLTELAENQPPKKRRGRPRKTVKKEELIDVPNEETEIKELSEKLINYGDRNPDIVLKPVNCKIENAVKNMSIEELRARCRQGKKICSSQLDNAVGSQIIWACNQTVGNLLDCYDELEASTKNDELLKKTTTDYFSLHILDYIPDELKMMGLYSSHVIKSYYEKLEKSNSFRPKNIVVEPPVKKSNEVAENAPRPPLKNKDIDVRIPPIEETRDILIKMKDAIQQI